jgi:hypothetical protein
VRSHIEKVTHWNGRSSNMLIVDEVCGDCERWKDGYCWVPDGRYFEPHETPFERRACGGFVGNPSRVHQWERYLES